MRAFVVAAGVLLQGCGLFLGSRHDAPLPDYIAHPNTAWHVEGEVRDESTLAPMGGADIVLETNRPGYALVRRADAGGRFAIGFSGLYRRVSGGEQLVARLLTGGEEPDAELVSSVTVRARAGGRCSPLITLRQPSATRQRPLLLLVGDCARYQARP